MCNQAGIENYYFEDDGKRVGTKINDKTGSGYPAESADVSKYNELHTAYGNNEGRSSRLKLADTWVIVSLYMFA